MCLSWKNNHLIKVIEATILAEIMVGIVVIEIIIIQTHTRENMSRMDIMGNPIT